MRGIHLQRNVVAVAQKALTANLRLLGPLVLPLPELVSLLALSCAYTAQMTQPLQLRSAERRHVRDLIVPKVDRVSYEIQHVPFCSALP